MSSDKNKYLQNFEQISAHLLGENLAWLQTVRQNHLQEFLRQGFPNRRQEQWKYTAPTFLENHFFSSTAETNPATLNPELIAKHTLAKNNPRLVFVNGHFSSALSTSDQLANDFKIMPLSQALLTQTAHVQTYLEKMPTPGIHSLADLNTAFMSDGLFMCLAKNVILPEPLHLLFITTRSTKPLMVAPCNIIILEDNSQATIFEEHIALNADTYYKNSVTQIHLNTAARLNYYKLQTEAENGFHVAVTEINQARDSQLYNYSISLGSQMARDDLQVNLNAAGAFCQLNGLYALTGARHVDHHTRVDHFSPQTTSEEYYKGILFDKAVGVFNGKILVHEGAQKSKSIQANKNLLLSKTAEINTKPELEIYADDVQCAHGATVGELDPEALFYLRARGIDKATATALLVQAFSDEIITRIKQPLLRQYIQAVVNAKILGSVYNTTRLSNVVGSVKEC